MILVGAGKIFQQLLAVFAAVMLATGTGTKLLIAALLMPVLYSTLLLAADDFGVRLYVQEEKLSTCRMAGGCYLCYRQRTLHTFCYR